MITWRTLADRHQNTCSIKEPRNGGGSSKSKSSDAKLGFFYFDKSTQLRTCFTSETPSITNNYFVCKKLRNLTSIDRHWSNISFSLHGWLHFKYIQMFSKIYRPGGNDISNIQQQQTVVCLNCMCMHI